MTPDITLRELAGVAELTRSEQFQIEVWGAGERPDNADIMLALQHEGALVAGAFAGDEMLGFLFGFPTATPGLQHSHRLAVSPRARGLG
ncbi:MAG: GNAT family N-acetyltransferase, partial [Sphingomonadales bacterium]|nr:GNAT family N-acetyltransferase [Sphingomonadales bacterium]